MVGKFERTLYDIKDEYQWIGQMGWSDDDLRRVPVHEEATSGQDYHQPLGSGAATSLGTSGAPESSPASGDARALRNIFVYSNETPRDLYDRLREHIRSNPSQSEVESTFGKQSGSGDAARGLIGLRRGNLRQTSSRGVEERAPVEYRRLGKSGLKVSVVGLGGNNFGAACDEERSVEVIRRALDDGINIIDTSDSYSQGVSEEYVGKALGGRRDEAIVATKAVSEMGPGPNDRGASRKHLFDACEASLRRLKTDHIDLYQLHRWDPETPLEESLRALDDLVRQGKVRYVGCSNFTAWQLVYGLSIQKQEGLAPFVSVQPHYNMFVRDVEKELLPACAQFGIGVIPYFPLASGLLTGKYEAGKAPPPDTRGARNARLLQGADERLKVVDSLKHFADGHGYSVAQLAVAWLAAHPEVSTVIAGATRPEQVDQNAGAADVKLSADDRKQIEAILGGPASSG